MEDLGFEEAAIGALKHWRYEPALDNGRPVSVYHVVKVDFGGSTTEP